MALLKLKGLFYYGLDCQRIRLCAGGELAFNLPVAAAPFIDKSSFFVLKLGVICLLKPKLNSGLTRPEKS